MSHVLSRQPAGVLPDGRGIEYITLSSPAGIRARVVTLGAALQALHVPDREGRSADIVLGYADPLDYRINAPYFGVTVGRYANRIAGARFTIDGRAHQLTANDGPHALHGGQKGLGRSLWTVQAASDGPCAAVRLACVSPAGEDGFPGELSVEVSYELCRGDLWIRHRARTDAATVVNLSNHSYFNLAGEQAGNDVYDHTLELPAAHFLPVDASLIPTGEMREVAGTPFDFRGGMRIGQQIRCASERQILRGRGYDHSWIDGIAPRAEARLMARLRHEGSGRTLEVFSNQPAVQVYTGNFLDGTVVGKSGLAYRQGDGIALEPQLLPDTPNRSEFGSARLDPGGSYAHDMLLRLTVPGA